MKKLIKKRWEKRSTSAARSTFNYEIWEAQSLCLRTCPMPNRFHGFKTRLLGITYVLAKSMIKIDTIKQSKSVSCQETLKYCLLEIWPKLERRVLISVVVRRRESLLPEPFTLIETSFWWMILFRPWTQTLKRRSSRMYLSVSSKIRQEFLWLTPSISYTWSTPSSW